MADRPRYDRLRVLFFGGEEGPVEIQTLEGGAAKIDLLGSGGGGEGRSGDGTLGVEARDKVRFAPLVEEILARLSARPGRRFYFVLPDRAAAAVVAARLRRRSLGPFELYGIDPDYYHGLVPITGGGHRQMESFLLGLKPAYTRTQKLRRLVKRWLIALGASARLYEEFVIVGGDRPMPASFLLRNWESLVGGPAPSRLRVATITSCLHAHGNDLALVFLPGSRRPDYLMKISRDSRFGFKLEREHAALLAVGCDRSLGPLVPRALHLGTFAGRRFLVQSGLPGVSLSRLLIERGLDQGNRRSVLEAVDLLQRINRISPEGREEGAAPAGEPPDLDRSEAEKLQAARLRLGSLSGSYRLQGDFWPNNLLVEHGRVSGIVDWEFAVPTAPLPTDIVWFLVNLAYVLETGNRLGVTPEDAYARAFFAGRPCTPLLTECMHRYFASMGIERELFLPLLQVSLGEMALREQVSYGQRGKMDAACLKMLRHTLRHEADLRVG